MEADILIHARYMTATEYKMPKIKCLSPVTETSHRGALCSSDREFNIEGGGLG